MSELIIRRQHAVWGDRLRDYAVFVDGRKVAEISNGAEARIPVSAGRHAVQLRIDWCQSNRLDIVVDENSDTIVECGPNAKPLLVLLYITFLRGQYLWLKAAAAASNASLRHG